LESWRLVWREGVLHCLPTKGLTALKHALETDDRRVTQASTTTPPNLPCVTDWPIECACPLAFVGWQGEDLKTVGQAEEFLQKVIFETGRRLGVPDAARWLLQWIDDTPRDEMFKGLLSEVDLALELRALADGPHSEACALPVAQEG
jgi:hypothetical protein